MCLNMQFVQGNIHNNKIMLDMDLVQGARYDAGTGVISIVGVVAAAVACHVC